MTTPPAWALGLAFIASLTLATLIKTFASRLNLLDEPNHRSSHSRKTPRGGGLGFVVAIAASFLCWTGLPWPITVCGAVIAIIGFADDVFTVSARVRLITQLAAALVLLTFLDPVVPLGGISQWILWVAGLLFICWLTNLYNFMDGIDGLAALQALLATSAIALLTSLGLGPASLLSPALFIAASIAGFMVMNWPPAKIFMGDTGSAFLGFVFAGLALVSWDLNQRFFWVWLIFLAVFVTDATVTLIVRFLRGEKIYQAHRSHLYQLLTGEWQRKQSEKGIDEDTARARAHRQYLICFTATFIFILFPAGWAVASCLLSGWLATALVYFPLALMHLLAGAGHAKLRIRVPS